MMQIAAVCVGLSAAGIGGTALAGHGPAHQLEVCCAWNSSLEDGKLTYRISGGDVTVQGAVRGAIEDWDVALNGLVLDEVVGNTPRDIDVRFKRGGGTTQGLALRSFDRAGFVRSVKVTISGAAFGAANNLATIAEIARHEVGHALGVGHANFDDLMDPTVGGSAVISGCDTAGVEAANRWKLVDGSGTPAPPLVDHVDC